VSRWVSRHRTRYYASADRARVAKDARKAKKPAVVVYDRDAGVGQIPPNLRGRG